ncbi:hypothetical protein FACS1894184_15080 [Clostridia bacterium]|nr:hypothetical protein FACS1894184_15080 [Clostridia bacterium]
MSSLAVNWATYEATKYACLNWHYSGTVPVGKLVKIGAWEDGKYIGVVIFSYGANNHIGEPYGLDQHSVCELTRVALCPHESFVSEILAKAIKMLKVFCPGLRLIVSYADAEQHHLGGIYQATNWIFTGKSDGERYFRLHGKKIHPKSLHSKGYKQSLPWLKKYVNADYEEFVTMGKYKYLMPLDAKMRKRIQPLAKPYPKKAKPPENEQSEQITQ